MSGDGRVNNPGAPTSGPSDGSGCNSVRPAPRFLGFCVILRNHAHDFFGEFRVMMCPRDASAGANWIRGPWTGTTLGKASAPRGRATRGLFLEVPPHFRIRVDWSAVGRAHDRDIAIRPRPMIVFGANTR